MFLQVDVYQQKKIDTIISLLHYQPWLIIGEALTKITNNFLRSSAIVHHYIYVYIFLPDIIIQPQSFENVKLISSYLS